MRIREIELDISDEAYSIKPHSVVRDESWEFGLATRCMTSMIERLIKPIENPLGCWKIVVICEEESQHRYQIVGGVLEVGVSFDFNRFWKEDELGKKIIVISKILEAIQILKGQVDLTLQELQRACVEIKEANYDNDWVWKKKKIESRWAQVRIDHNCKSVDIYLEFLEKFGGVLASKKVISTLPDEWFYVDYLGKLEKVNVDTVKLVSKGNAVVAQKFIFSQSEAAKKTLNDNERKSLSIVIENQKQILAELLQCKETFDVVAEIIVGEMLWYEVYVHGPKIKTCEYQKKLDILVEYELPDKDKISDLERRRLLILVMESWYSDIIAGTGVTYYLLNDSNEKEFADIRIDKIINLQSKIFFVINSKSCKSKSVASRYNLLCEEIMRVCGK
ncbi:MAG: hypothetical protein ACRCUS_03195 [Anaerovoracaceae bacterium]